MVTVTMVTFDMSTLILPWYQSNICYDQSVVVTVQLVTVVFVITVVVA